MNFLLRSACSLARLELHDTGVQVNEFIDCLQHKSVRGITELVVHDSCDWMWDPVITPQLVQLLTLMRGGNDLNTSCLLPALKALDLGLGKSCWACSNDSLSKMTESRWQAANSVARLEHVHLDLHLLADKSGPDHLRLEKLREGSGLSTNASSYSTNPGPSTQFHLQRP
ncbi:hypothetical protein R3P38DRAFT_3234340 [Favolaschia claudopus]|uniref:Uncharacterized protein n=1 Tax=Favolaschia claudopus TaxID=2862362 RepID=A0AAV9ZFZ8_9AGAR